MCVYVRGVLSQSQSQSHLQCYCLILIINLYLPGIIHYTVVCTNV